MSVIARPDDIAYVRTHSWDELIREVVPLTQED
jgi:hypothetical protein